MKIPKGWRKLKRGTVLKQSDHLFIRASGTHSETMFAGRRVGQSIATRCTYIRRKKHKKKADK